MFPFVQLGRNIDRRFNGGIAGFLGDQFNPFEVARRPQRRRLQGPRPEPRRATPSRPAWSGATPCSPSWTATRSTVEETSPAGQGPRRVLREGPRPDHVAGGQEGLRPGRRSRTGCATPTAATPFGQSCLLARRLIEAGVHFVTVTDGGWDTHQNNFKSLKDAQAAGAGPRLLGPAAGPARPRPAGQHAGGVVRRLRPDAEDQPVGRPRPLGHRPAWPAWAAAASRRARSSAPPTRWASSSSTTR